MKTAVYQSFRTRDVPRWISRCLESVRQWADGAGHDYLFYGDELFEVVPPWYRKRVNDQIHLVSDLGRLNLARKLLAEGYERVIWVDADVLVFDPAALVIDCPKGYAFCNEVYLELNGPGHINAMTGRVNNAVMAFERNNNGLLDFYIQACETIVRNAETLPHTAVGPSFLSPLNASLGLGSLVNVGMFSPLMLWAQVNDNAAVMKVYAEQFGAPVYAANLCNTFRNVTYRGLELNDGLYDTVVDKLLASRGEMINRHLWGASAPQAATVMPT